MRAMDSRRDFTSKKVFPGHFSELGEKANSALEQEIIRIIHDIQGPRRMIRPDSMGTVFPGEPRQSRVQWYQPTYH